MFIGGRNVKCVLSEWWMTFKIKPTLVELLIVNFFVHLLKTNLRVFQLIPTSITYDGKSISLECWKNCSTDVFKLSNDNTFLNDIYYNIFILQTFYCNTYRYQNRIPLVWCLKMLSSFIYWQVSLYSIYYLHLTSKYN